MPDDSTIDALRRELIRARGEIVTLKRDLAAARARPARPARPEPTPDVATLQQDLAATKRALAQAQATLTTLRKAGGIDGRSREARLARDLELARDRAAYWQEQARVALAANRALAGGPAAGTIPANPAVCDVPAIPEAYSEETILCTNS